MQPTHIHSRLWRSKTLWLVGTLLAASGCTETPAPAPGAPATQAQGAEEDGVSEDLAKLPFVDAKETTRVFVQQLKAPTKLEENVAVSVKLPPPINKELADSFVRVLGDPANPLVLVRSDALEKLGRIPTSPGPEFFTTFARLPQTELERRLKSEDAIASGQFGEVTDEHLQFDGRRVVARTNGIPLDLTGFLGGTPIPINLCKVLPKGSMASWGQSLLITDPAVVLDPARTWDPCTGAGTQGGKWTFSHLVKEMANGSGLTPSDFVKDWLSKWLNSYTVNGDAVAPRTQMFAQVIQPWATASGVSSALVTNPTTGKLEVLLGGPLNLDIAPFRLLAIVNRIDLGGTTAGGPSYSGNTSARPKDAGELRFVFGVTKPNPWGAGTQATCGLKPFTVIFEYGVPRTGCQQVVNWAQQWTQLNTYGGFTAGYLAQLEGMTESVVLHGAAPTKGNQNAINQIRTNENTLNTRWELREFTLTTENPAANTNVPTSGPLQPHTVAQTPNDGAFSAGGLDADINDFVLQSFYPVKPSVVLSPAPDNCSSSYTVPYKLLNGKNFRGGNALVATPNQWLANSASPFNPVDVCARHEFSLNTCNGCHFGETATTGGLGNTAFTHISPTSGIPAQLSKFLTGGGTGLTWSVNDKQFPTVKTWHFADLARRNQRLYQLAHCTSCNIVISSNPVFLDRMQELAGVVPIDPSGPIEKTQFKAGPIRDLDQVSKLLDMRPDFQGEPLDAQVDFIEPAQAFVH